MSSYNFLAFDLGAESGRTVLGRLENNRLAIQELSRFPNDPILVNGHLHWNIFNLFDEVKKGMRAYATEIKMKLEGLAVDTWGVDFGLLARDGSILGLPYSYRDLRTQGAMEEFFSRVSKKKIYDLTGIQFMPFNSLFQLFAMARDRSPLLEIASDLLFMPDLFHYLLTGEKTSEFTMSTTSQLFNPREKRWNDELFGALGISNKIMQKPLTPGTVIGNLLEATSREVGLKEAPVIATATHDTASAIAAIPAESRNFAYISSGTWSCIGIEVDNPIINEQALEHNFTNEGGVEETIRFLKNCIGLWLLQQCRKSWAQKQTYTYEELTRMAVSAPAFKALINPDSVEFLNPPDMPEAIRQFTKRTKQPPPEMPAEFIRCILESLALRYRFIVNEIQELSPHPIQKLHIIGGGAKNHLLNQLTADATGLTVVAGPFEATAMGNILGQALALGYVRSLDEIRAITRNSSELLVYEPQQTTEWGKAYERFQNIVDS